MVDLTGQRILITGGSRGIGGALVVEAVRQGARVVFCCRNLRGADNVMMRCAELGMAEHVWAIEADVCLEQGRSRILEVCQRALGGLDVLVNNAGLVKAGVTALSSMSVLDEVLSANVDAAYRVAVGALRLFPDRVGTVVFVSSVAALGMPYHTAYSFAKGCELGLASAFAELGTVRSYGAVVGFVDTAMTAGVSPELGIAAREQSAVGRLADPEEVAKVLAFLSSRECPVRSGENVYVSGGSREAPYYQVGSSR